MSKINADFFNRPTQQVARDLLGKFLVRKINNQRLSVMITETEAYIGPNDKASHASKGKTERTKVMFYGPGYYYVYLIYGMYYCLNIVTEKTEYPAAVLIRSAIPVENLPIIQKNRAKFQKSIKPIPSKSLTNGPGKLCQALKINNQFNGQKVNNTQMWLEDRSIKIKPNQLKKLTRVGIDYAQEYKDKLWRFKLET